MTELTTTAGHLLGTAERPVVHVERTLDATPAEVWAAWTRPEQLVRWLGAVDGALDRPGSTVRMAMAATELPATLEDADNPARFHVRSATPPDAEEPGRLVIGFEDAADPAGTVTVTMRPTGDGRCHLTLMHALTPASEHGPGFGAGWEGFLDWLDGSLTGREHTADDATYEAALPGWERRSARLALVRPTVVRRDGDTSTVVCERELTAPPAAVWARLTAPDGLVGQLGTVVDGALEPDGIVTVVHGDDPATSTQVSEIRAWEPERRLEMTWGFSGEPTSYLTITLAPSDAGTRLVLEHAGLAADGGDYATGWHAHLDQFAASTADGDVPGWDVAIAAARACTG